MNRNLLAIDQRQIRELNAESGYAFNAASLDRFCYAATYGLARFSNDDTINNKGFHQTCRKRIAFMVSIRRQDLINAHREIDAGRNVKSGWYGRVVLLLLIVRLLWRITLWRITLIRLLRRITLRRSLIGLLHVGRLTVARLCVCIRTAGRRRRRW